MIKRPDETQTEFTVRCIQAEVWDRCASEAHDLGWLHDWALSDLLERNPYRTPDG